MGGGGGPDYTAIAAAEEAKKQKARDAINSQFGVAGAGSAPDRNSFWREVQGDPAGAVDGYMPAPERVFDRSGFDAAQAAWDKLQADTKANADARGQLYGTVRTNAFDAGKRKLDEQRTTAGRDLKFELFAKGLNGGSVDVDQNAQLGRTYSDGLLDLGAKADTVANDMRTADESTRMGLLSSVNAGMDQGSAMSSALNQLKTNSDKAAADATGTAVGDLFAGGGAIYNQSVQRRQRAQGQQDFLAQLAAMRGTSGPAAPAKGANGTITSTRN